MTDFNHEEASKQIARIYSTEIQFNLAKRVTADGEYFWACECKYITQDLGALMELAIRNEISVHPFIYAGTIETVYNVDGLGAIFITEYISNYNNDPIESTCVAIAKALIKKCGE